IQAGGFAPSSPARSNAHPPAQPPAHLAAQPSSSSSSSSSLPRDGSRLVPGAHPRIASSLTTTQSPDLPGTPARDLRQRSVQLLAEGELQVTSSTAAPLESKTESDRETKHTTRTPKRRREKQEQEPPRNILDGKAREPDKKPRAQRWIDPAMSKYVASHGDDRVAALRAALSSTDPPFLEGLSQHLRNQLAQSQPYGTAVQTVACEIGLALGSSFTSQYSAEASCVHLLRGLLREHDGAGSAVCTTDLADIAQGMRDARLSESEGDPSRRFAHHARLLSRALEAPTQSQEHARALYLQVAVPSSYPAHMFGADADGVLPESSGFACLKHARDFLALQILENFTGDEVNPATEALIDHLDHLAGLGETYLVAMATEALIHNNGALAPRLIRRALERTDGNTDVCGQVLWAAAIRLHPQTGEVDFTQHLLPSDPIQYDVDELEGLNMRTIHRGMFADLIDVARQGDGSEARLIRLGRGLAHAVDYRLAIAEEQELEDDADGILQALVTDPATPLTPAQRVAFAAGLAMFSVSKHEPLQTLKTKLHSDDAACTRLIALGIVLANPLEFAQRYGLGEYRPASTPAHALAWGALGHRAQENLLAAAFMASPPSTLEHWQGVLLEGTAPALLHELVPLLYRRAPEVHASTFKQAQAFFIAEMARATTEAAQRPDSKSGDANIEVGNVFAVLCDVLESFKRANGWREDDDAPGTPLRPEDPQERAKATALLGTLSELIEMIADIKQTPMPPMVAPLYLQRLRDDRDSLALALAAGPQSLPVTQGIGPSSSSSSSSSSITTTPAL
ncbi:MAG: hypothetical protein V4609_03220, partial [Pseudomonadota bacterium]